MCVFCEMKPVLENDLALAFFDKYPVNNGHMLIIPKRHAATFFDMTREEQTAVNDLLMAGKVHLEVHLVEKPDGYNIGYNCGQWAGQTVMHAHCHLMPRYQGDVPNPKYGIRAVIPERMAY